MTAQMTEALLKWLSTFKNPNASQAELKSWNDVSDGVAMAKVLHRIDSSHFNAGKKHLSQSTPCPLPNELSLWRQIPNNLIILMNCVFNINRLGVQNSGRYTN